MCRNSGVPGIGECYGNQYLQPDIPADEVRNDIDLQRLLQAFKEIDHLFMLGHSQQLATPSSSAALKGYVILDRISDSSNQTLVISEFSPILLKQQEDKMVLEYPSIDVAMDEFFSTIDFNR